MRPGLSWIIPRTISIPVMLAISLAVMGMAARAPAFSLRPLPAASTEVTAFVNVGVVPMDAERVLASQTVLIKDGRITALGPGSQIKVPAGATRIEGRGRYLIPGLTDCHAHIGQSLNVQGMTDDSVDAERRLLAWLANGVTTIRNLDYEEVREGSSQRLTGATLLRLRARAAAGTLWSPRIYTSGPWTEGPSTDAILWLASYKAAGYDFFKVRNHGPAGTEAILAAARQVGLPVVGHVSDDLPVERVFALGMKSIEHLTGYLPFWGRPLTDTSTAYFQMLAEKSRRAGAWNCPTMMQQLMIYRPDRVRLSGRVVKALQEAGAGVLLGTDGGAPGIPPGLSLHGELAQLVQAGLTPYQALAAGTRNPAIYFGTLDSTGTVAVGKRADLVLLRGNPIADIRNTAEPAGVMVGGRWLTRAALDRRMAAIPPGKHYPARAYADVFAALANLKMKHLTFSPRQASILGQLMMVHGTQRQALHDSLGAQADSVRGQRHEIDLIARQAGELRAGLTPAQQAAFDPPLRLWQTARATEGYRVTIPGVTK